MSKFSKVGVIGSGSWATALVKIFSENDTEVLWFVKNPSTLKFIKSHGKNPKYLTNIKLDLDKISVYDDINFIVNNCEVFILAIPSQYLEESFIGLNIPIRKKIIFSGIKGIVPEHFLVTEYLNKKFKVPINQLGVISGPCHAEEVAIKKLSFLTLGCSELKIAKKIKENLTCSYISVEMSTDRIGIELTGILKNIYSIAIGMVNGLGYGDNFTSTFFSFCYQEMKNIIHVMSENCGDINESVYLGDLLVTSYSSFSRNRKLGIMIGEGLSVSAAKNKMTMIAEGYYSSKFFKNKIISASIDAPIINLVYNVLHEKKPLKIYLQNYINQKI
tara:strand:+ start:37 stop:1029 length:993 start_codon:yes stop_codon:yes gene_type:complete